MADSLYVLRVNHLHSKPMYYTTYLDHRTLLIASPDKEPMQLLQTSLTHHRDKNRTWLNRGVFCREKKDNQHVLHLTDHNNYNKKFRAFDFALHLSPQGPPFDLVELSLDNPRHMDEIRRMYHFANTNLFIMDDYEYNPKDAYLSIQGIRITLPEQEQNSLTPTECTQFLNELI